MKTARITICGAISGLILAGAAAWAQNQPTAAEFGDQVTAYAASELQTWINDPVIVYAIREANETNAGMTDRQIQRLDRLWIKEEGAGPMIYDLLDRQASVIVRDRRELSKGVITEIIVMDQWGMNVAISDPTSDMYQGDEAKYQDTYLKGPGAVHVSEIEYDESTKLNQTQVSMTVVDPETGQAIGAVTFGVNLSVLNSLSN